MTSPRCAYTGARILEGGTLLKDHALLVLEDGTTRILPQHQLPPSCRTVASGGGIVMPGFVDLQVNGGGGVMFNDAPHIDTLRTIAAAHHGLGTAAILPTLITDTPDHTCAAIAAVRAALDQKVPGIAGLHLEGPHLSLARKGAHQAALIRPMTPEDLAQLLHAADHIENLMITVAPESVSPPQIAALAAAGAIVSLGHSDCDYETAMAAFDAGATCATHLFNAMSQPSARAPGLVGAALDHGGVSCGLIADGVHVHPAMIRVALAAKSGHGEMFLVTDAMATAGSDITGFTLNGREISRDMGRLTLADGTLAGADLTLLQAIRYMVNVVGQPLESALASATSIPAGRLRAAPALARIENLVWLADDLNTVQVLGDL